jgi:hypothetical protein
MVGCIDDHNNRLEAGATNDETKDLMTKEDGIIVALSGLFEKFAKGIKNKHYLRVVVIILYPLPLSNPTPTHVHVVYTCIDEDSIT